jgi:hypothetical protein
VREKAKYPSPTYSPWDNIQTRERLADGVYWVSTPGHGGLMVHSEVAEVSLTAEARNEGMLCNYSGVFWYAYEEDCKYAIPFFECPQWLRASREQDLKDWQRIIERPAGNYPEMVDQAPRRVAALKAKLELSDQELVADARLLHTISMWDAQYLINSGIEPDPDGYAKFLDSQDRDRRRAAHDPDFIISAIGIWGSTVEPGHDGQVKVTTADHKEHFVTAESYPPADGSYLLSRCVLAPVLA